MTEQAVHSLDRRSFLGKCGGCAMLAACAGGFKQSSAAQTPAATGPATTGKTRVRLVFTHRPAGLATWPYATYDYEGRKRFLTEKLMKACPAEIDLLPPVTLHDPEAAQALLKEDSKIGVDGYLVSMVGIWTRAPWEIAIAGKPTLFVDDLYAGSGEFLTQFAAARRAGMNVAGVSSSRFDDVLPALQCFQGMKDPSKAAAFAAICMAKTQETYATAGDMSLSPADACPRYDVSEALKRLGETAILVVGSQMHTLAQPITSTFGTRVVPIEFATLEAACQKADKDQAADTAESWIKQAAAVVEPDRDEIVKSAGMYLGMKELLKSHNARAIAIDCLGGFYGGHMSAYPCLGFTQFNDDGLVGACEADMRSTITMLAMNAMINRPGFISDPVIDTATHQIIYAHCVAPTKVDGPSSPANAYEIRSHSEDRHGASLRSLLPLGRMTTTIELDPVKKEILFHQGKSVANIDEDKACRTKLAVDLKGDIDKLFNEWDQWGWHRVTFYGDLEAPVRELADRIGFAVIQEA